MGDESPDRECGKETRCVHATHSKLLFAEDRHDRPRWQCLAWMHDESCMRRWIGLTSKSHSRPERTIDFDGRKFAWHECFAKSNQTPDDPETSRTRDPRVISPNLGTSRSISRNRACEQIRDQIDRTYRNGRRGDRQCELFANRRDRADDRHRSMDIAGPGSHSTGSSADKSGEHCAHAGTDTNDPVRGTCIQPGHDSRRAPIERAQGPPVRGTRPRATSPIQGNRATAGCGTHAANGKFIALKPYAWGTYCNENAIGTRPLQ